MAARPPPLDSAKMVSPVMLYGLAPRETLRQA